MHGSHRRRSRDTKPAVIEFSSCTDTKYSVQLDFIAQIIKPLMFCCTPSWPQSLSHVSLPILESFSDSPPPPSPTLPGDWMQPDTHLGPSSQSTRLCFLVSVCIYVSVCVGSSVQRCSHSPAETDRWNHFTHRQKGRIQETGVCLIVLALLWLVLI